MWHLGGNFGMETKGYVLFMNTVHDTFDNTNNHTDIHTFSAAYTL